MQWIWITVADYGSGSLCSTVISKASPRLGRVAVTSATTEGDGWKGISMVNVLEGSRHATYLADDLPDAGRLLGLHGQLREVLSKLFLRNLSLFEMQKLQHGNGFSFSHWLDQML